MGTVISAAVVFTAWLWVCRKVRAHQAAQAASDPKQKFSDLRDAILRADEATDQDRIEMAARLQ